jgi:hypothetical protein
MLAGNINIFDCVETKQRGGMCFYPNARGEREKNIGIEIEICQ